MSELTSNTCLIEWQPAKLSSASLSEENSDLLEYCVQLQSMKKDSDYKEVYKGELCSYRLKNLESNTDYNVRVCAIRVCSSESNRICSPFTSHTSFTTLKISSNKTNNQNNRKSVTDLQPASSLDLTAKESTTNFSKISRFILPSFYLNLNTSKYSNAKTNGLSFSTQPNQSKMQSNLINTISNSKKSASTAKNVSRKLSEPNLTSNSHDTISNRNITDQQWAFLIIIIVLIIAVFIACVANFFFNSYYDLSSEL